MGSMRWLMGACAALAFASASVQATAAEYNPVPPHPVSIGPEADRLIVGFRATDANSATRIIHSRLRPEGIQLTQAETTAVDVARLADRARIAMATSRRLTPNMHVMYLPHTLYGAAVDAALAVLRADPAVAFADVDQRRYPHSLPNDPLFIPSSGAAGQWYMMTPSTLTSTSDAAATDALSAWNLTTGSTGTVIADVDTGVVFDHPDLLRAGFGGRMLPGYDFVAEDQNPTTGAALGTYLIANDGDGWDPDPSDPGDWINSADQMNTVLFPAANCSVSDSSWHGTRVMGILGATTDNDVGIAGMSWGPYLLPVRALGKCGGYDSDIIAGIQWAAGLPVDGAPVNPYPADIINLSLGGSGSCPSDYANVITTMTTLGVLVVASAGNESGPVDAPGNCAGVLAVAGLRNIGTKVGYSSLGAEVGVGAPAGNCVNSSGACLRSIDTTSNSGLTVPNAATYTNETNDNLGTSFSAPIVSGIAALMRAVNANLTPAQLIARIEASASAFPQPTGLPVCPAVASDGSGECACPRDGSQCGAGMVNASAAVNAALRPIAAAPLPVVATAGSAVVVDAGGSSASCGRTVAGYAWTASGGVTIQSGANTAKVTVVPGGTSGTLSLTVTDSSGAIDTASIVFSSSGASTTAPSSAGSSATACPTPMTVTPNPPTVSQSFSPASVNTNVVSTLTITLANSNGFALTQSNFTEMLPANLTVAAATSSGAAPASTCTGAALQLNAVGSSVSLSGANVPAKGSCTITLAVESASPGNYTASVDANALRTAPAGANAAAASADLTVTTPSKSGGGEIDGWDMLFVVGVLLAGRRHAKRRSSAPHLAGPR